MRPAQCGCAFNQEIASTCPFDRLRAGVISSRRGVSSSRGPRAGLKEQPSRHKRLVSRNVSRRLLSPAPPSWAGYFSRSRQVGGMRPPRCFGPSGAERSACELRSLLGRDRRGRKRRSQRHDHRNLHPRSLTDLMRIKTQDSRPRISSTRPLFMAIDLSRTSRTPALSLLQRCNFGGGVRTANGGINYCGAIRSQSP